MTAPRRSRSSVASPVATPGGVLGVVGALALVVAAFLPWTDTGAVAVDLSLRAIDATALPTVGFVVIVVGALPALAALVTPRGWPRTLAAVLAGVTTLAWLGGGPDGALVAGVWTALGACVALLFAAALAD